MGDTPKLAVSVPPRASFEALFTGGFSPGPMTLVSSFFADPDNCSFSQLLAGAMASPIAKPTTNIFPADITTSGSSAAATSTSSGDDASERERVVSGYKQNRPMGLVLAQSPLFMVPSGLTPSGLLNSPGFLSPLQSPFGMSHQQALAHVTAQAAFTQSYMQLQAEFQRPFDAASVEALEDQSSPVPSESLQQQVHSVPQEPVVKIESPEISQSDIKLASSVDKLENDGYNWRKYGQKQVKASEHPRSYYKCTYLNCPVKKKVERSVEGHITEITYKGQHSHDPPQLSRRTKDGSGPTGVSISQTKPMHGSQGQNDISTFIHADLASREAHVSVQMSSEHLSVTNEDGGLQDNTIIVKEDDESDQPNPKRICSEVGVSAPASSHKTVTEPRIIVQTRSEVDLLDDGYKWRKYGQKVVKGNPYPRSYYRCTYVGCNVRKHVERASADPKAVITTYEGKHNHSIPTAKNNCNNTTKSYAGQSKSQKMITGKRSLHTEMQDFEMKNQIPVLLQLKEGEIAA